MKLFPINRSVLLLPFLFFFFSCEDLTEDPQDPPSVTYSATNLSATFYEAGNSPAPNINWNGDQGTISLASNIDGITINSTTGVINWDKELAVGSYDLQVIFANSGGNTVVDLKLENPLQGTFTGVFDVTEFFQFTFTPDGNATLKAGSDTPPAEGTGTWTYDNGEILVNYEYNDFPGFSYSIKGTLSISASEAVYEGQWFNDFNAAGSAGGTFEIVLD